MNEPKTLVIVGKECIFIEGEYGYDIDKGDIKAFKQWAVCGGCQGTMFELSHGDYQLISRCVTCYKTQVEYDG